MMMIMMSWSQFGPNPHTVLYHSRLTAGNP